MNDDLVSFDETTKKNISSWLNSSISEKEKEEIKELISSHPDQAQDAFYTSLKFGTGGVRALMGLGTNRLNLHTIGQITQGFANFLNDKHTHPTVVICFDSRKHSYEFALACAEVFAGNQIKTIVFEKLRPTPFLSFACRHYKAQGAIMLTASHNPKEYNGYKVYGPDGAQLVSPDDTAVMAHVEKIQDFSQVQKTSTQDWMTVMDSHLDESYLESTLPFFFQLPQNKDKGSQLNIVYSPLHGTGITLLPSLLEKLGFANVALVEKQSSPDSDFPYAPKPNPEEKEVLQYGVDQLVSTKADIFIATDPDADRISIVALHENQPYYFNGNQTACLLLSYIIDMSSKKRRSNDAAIKTIVTSDLFSQICYQNKVHCTEMLTGFKYIGEQIRLWEKTNEYHYLFGAEESYGCLIGDYVRDKDAISAGALLAEMALDLKLQGKTLVHALHELYDRYGFYQEALHSITLKSGPEGMKQLETIMSQLRSSPLDTIGSYQVEAIEDYQKQTKTSKEGQHKMDHLPVSNVLLFRLENKGKVVIRPSGTEPKIKIYLGVHITEDLPINEKAQQAEKQLAELFTAFEKLCVV